MFQGKSGKSGNASRKHITALTQALDERLQPVTRAALFLFLTAVRLICLKA